MAHTRRSSSLSQLAGSSTPPKTLAQVLSESLGWMARAVEEFTLAAFGGVRALGEWLKADLASSNAAVRNAAIGLAGAAHRQLGAGLGEMLRPHVKPALMSALDDAFAKHPQQEVILLRTPWHSVPATAQAWPPLSP